MADQEQGTETEVETRDGATPEQDKTTDKGKTDEPKYTQADFDRALQKGIKTALDNADAKAAERLKAAEEAARREKLEAEGKWEELLTDTRAELAAVKSGNELRDYQLDARKMLDTIGMGDYADELIGDPESIERTRERALELKAKNDALIQKAVEERLKTPKPLPDKSNQNINDGMARAVSLAQKGQPRYLAKQQGAS